ncbi:hypothetical protein ACFQRB_08990 [Halobaculum litoreum]|uniref:Uncharacterized protein n=1 Tax=Halobaculum litoreum TaxID=3031998 RepID=A0ABD5XSV4_9EURY
MVPPRHRLAGVGLVVVTAEQGDAERLVEFALHARRVRRVRHVVDGDQPVVVGRAVGVAIVAGVLAHHVSPS